MESSVAGELKPFHGRQDHAALHSQRLGEFVDRRRTTEQQPRYARKICPIDRQNLCREIVEDD